MADRAGPSSSNRTPTAARQLWHLESLRIFDLSRGFLPTCDGSMGAFMPPVHRIWRASSGEYVSARPRPTPALGSAPVPKRDIHRNRPASHKNGSTSHVGPLESPSPLQANDRSWSQESSPNRSSFQSIRTQRLSQNRKEMNDRVVNKVYSI